MLPERVPLVLLHALGHVTSEVRCSDLPPVAEADHVLPPPDHHLGRKIQYLIVHGQYHIIFYPEDCLHPWLIKARKDPPGISWTQLCGRNISRLLGFLVGVLEHPFFRRQE